MKFKVSCAQISPILGDIEKNTKLHLKYIDRAIAKRSDMVVFPELSLTGYSVKDLNLELALNPYTSKLLEPLRLRSKKISIVCGGIEEDDNFGIFNSAFYFEAGKLQFTHKKVYPPDYGMFEEIRYFSRGKQAEVHETKFGKLGVLVCEDLWHISLPLLQALKGAKVIIGIAVSPTRLALNSKSKILKNYEINSEQHKAYARLLSLYLVFCNRVGYEDGVNFWGGSEIVDPFGTVDKVAKFFDEDMITSEINMNSIKRARQLARHFLDEDVNFLRNEVSILHEGLSKI
ncbi:MAG TPA: nitrilase-related carbon-nitrogen hydrolase [Ignavibacteria bacterium]|nr:nitrilase-related carbon-nitrogen hydrolase [Ignavibacteria bacterium]